MKSFLYKALIFVLPLTLFFISGLFLPATPRASKSLFFANLQKDKLLKTTEHPRIIFVGGSNLSLGLNSQMIKDSLKLNPVNTAVNAYVGLKYMMDNTIQYVKEGDIVVLVPEYFHHFKEYNDSSEELLRTVFEANPSKIKLLNFTQLFKTIPHIPKYTLSKFNPAEYFNVVENDVYGVNSFNQYGDTFAHWGEERREFQPYEINEPFNPSVIKAIKEFESDIRKKNAALLISYPCYQDLSYLKSEEKINKVEEAYINNGFTVLGNAERYVFPDSVMFDTPYHLIKPAVDQRTAMFIEDFKMTDLIINK